MTKRLSHTLSGPSSVLRTARAGNLDYAQRVEVEFDAEAVRLLAEEGFDPEFGARPLRRTIQRRVENELSRLLLGGTVEPGDKVAVSASGDDLHFEVETGAAAELLQAEDAEQEEAAATPA